MNRAGTTCPVPGKTWEGSGGEVRLGPRRFACLALLVLALVGVEAGAGYTTIVDNGPSDNRVDVVFLGDGYTAADLGAGSYSAHINATLDHMFSDGEEPFVRYRNFFNVHRIDVVSAESGADIPAEGIYRNTALDASYEGSSLAVSGPKADAAMAAGLQGAGFSAEIKLVTVNHTTYGGGAGAGGYAVYAGGSAYGSEAALHEMGHTFVSLADEYVTRDAAYTGPEPPEANITAGANPGHAKWAAWIGYTDPGHPGMGAIGLYEGARYYKYGLYRPSVSSKMRTLGQPFDAVSREQIILRIYERVDPLDRWLPNDSVVTDPAQLWVEVVDSDVIGVQWSVDGSPVQGATEQMFDLLRHGFPLLAWNTTTLVGAGFLIQIKAAGCARADDIRVEVFIGVSA